MLGWYTIQEINRLLQDIFQPTFQTTNTRDYNVDGAGLEGSG